MLDWIKWVFDKVFHRPWAVDAIAVSNQAVALSRKALDDVAKAHEDIRELRTALVIALEERDDCHRNMLRIAKELDIELDFSDFNPDPIIERLKSKD